MKVYKKLLGLDIFHVWYFDIYWFLNKNLKEWPTQNIKSSDATYQKKGDCRTNRGPQAAHV